MDLPNLLDDPKHHPDCCLGLSKPLIDKLILLLPKAPDVSLSIGSGSGLLEAYLAQRNCRIEGVEVNSNVNTYLPEESTYTVGGTWDLCDRAAAAKAWIFVYPRTPKLVTQYVETYGSAAVQVIVWLGPRVDWADFEACFQNLSGVQIEVGEDCGVVTPYEMLAVIRKTTP
ncbi:hypothetical protein K490DRAFT_31788 [Saccharata proteae CBS 121410]|uniref:Uncharacterized protein n=1 Tax=Saccharata proteae CBS 121410 TaxID=1314787 RepID=A0A9P4M225_9PEZI|nr:hypothetical protein K490DRAFT_31788 [Saccharata proteae CBS 121410]